MSAVTCIRCRRNGAGLLARMRAHQLTMLLLSLVVLVTLLVPRTAFAQGSDRIVRVGWFESDFNTTDELGRRSGYAYEYQQKIAAHTGWTYEYVEGSWPDLLQMLKEGKIDLLSDVSYTEERAEQILYASVPMGEEEYYLFVEANNESISPEDPSTLSGKIAGVNKGSIQADLFREWCKSTGADPQIEELTGLEDENLSMLKRGAIDMYVTLDSFGEPGRTEPLCKIGSSDFYFAVSKTQPDLLAELNAALYQIQDENQFYNQELTAKYLQTTQSNHYLNSAERAWVTNHQVIKVGYQDNYLAFCATDPDTGQLTGALKDYLNAATECLKNVKLEFEPVAFTTAEDALKALKNGEVDCVFPANLTDYDGEVQGFFMTAPVMRTDMSAVIRESDVRTFAKRDHTIVAVNVGNTNYDMFLLDHFPEWRSIYFTDTPECLKAISDGKADCLLISNYRYNNIASLCKKYKLTTLSTGVEMDYSFAVNRDDTVLYAILNKVASAVPSSTINAALTHYFTEDAKTSLSDTLRDNLLTAIGVFAIVSILVVSVVVFNTRQRRNRPRQKKS